MSIDKTLERLFDEKFKELNKTIENKFNHLQASIERTKKGESRNIGTREVAQILGISVSHFNQSIKFRDDFPMPINQDEVERRNAHPKWCEADIHDFRLKGGQ